jgi:hypothetical protein
MPEQLTFSGDAITFLGLVGVVSTAIIIVTSFRRFFNSPYNISVKTQKFVDVAEGTMLTEDRNSNFPNENTIEN